MTDPARVNRFQSGPEQSSVEKGYQDVTKSPYNASFLYRNLKPYKSLKRFANPAGLKKLKGMSGNYSRYERLAATAVLKDAGIKRRKLDVTMGNNGFRKPLLKRADAKVDQGFGIRVLGQTGKSVSDIQNKRLTAGHEERHQREAQPQDHVHQHLRRQGIRHLHGPHQDLAHGQAVQDRLSVSANTSLVRLLTSGQKQPGYCKLCSFSDPKLQDEFDRRVLEYAPAALNEWLHSRIDMKHNVDRKTIYNHREHVRNPKDRIVNAVARRQAEHGSLPARVSEGAFLDAVIALGQARAMADPESVTIDHALKATQIKAQSKSKGDAHAVLIQLFTGRMPPSMTVIEGEYQEA